MMVATTWFRPTGVETASENSRPADYARRLNSRF
jgi:hypothetical protein